MLVFSLHLGHNDLIVRRKDMEPVSILSIVFVVSSIVLFLIVPNSVWKMLFQLGMVLAVGFVAVVSGWFLLMHWVGAL